MHDIAASLPVLGCGSVGSQACHTSGYIGKGGGTPHPSRLIPRPKGCDSRDALEGKRPQRWPQQPLDRRLEEVAKAVGGGYCRLQMPLKLALGVMETVAGHRLGALEGGVWHKAICDCSCT